MHQVDDFAIAAPDQRTTDILLDMLDDRLTMPMKRQGLLNMYNGIDVLQMLHYVKINCHTYISKFCTKYLDSWLGKVPLTANRPTPLPTDSTWLKKFNAATGLTNPSEQAKLASAMHI